MRNRDELSSRLMDNVVSNISKLNSEMLTQSFMAQYDTHNVNGDAALDATELLAWMRTVHTSTGSSSPKPERPVAAQVISMMDKDSDGSISKKEWMNWVNVGRRTLLIDEYREKYKIVTNRISSLTDKMQFLRNIGKTEQCCEAAACW